MLGIDDGVVALVFVLCLLSSALCVGYAWINWNRGDDTVQEEDKDWRAGENKVEENI